MTFDKRPAWLDSALFYEIYPQSFKDTNGDGIGDFQGIIDKLDYICELGCNALWLNPCFASPFGDAGYDVADYYTAAPRYGTNEDLKRLFAVAHRRGMHVFLDLVPGHTSIEHPWFRESMKAEKNAYTDRYIWTDNIWVAPDDLGIRWLRGISDRNGSAAVNFFSNQPALNYGFYRPTEPWQQPVDAPGPQATIRAMEDVMAFWLNMGCDGFRVDMAGWLVKGDEDSKGTIGIWQGIRKHLDERFPDAALVSEWGEPDKSLRAGFHMDFMLQGSITHYDDLFRCEEPYFSSRGKGNAALFAGKFDEYRAKAGSGLLAIISGNHDIDRLARRLTPEEMKLAFAFLLSMPGVPFIYYGDEIGMRYVENLTSKEGGYNRTGSRTPMQWDHTPNAGFSAASPEKLYIPQDPDENRPTVEKQMADEHSLWREVQALIALRKAHPALNNCGGYELVSAGYPLVYRRSAPGENITVIVNPADKPARVQTAGHVLHTVGCGARVEDGMCLMEGCTAVSLLEE